MAEDIDEIRDRAREDARHQKELARSRDLYQNIRSLVSPHYKPPKGPFEGEYKRVYQDEKKR